MLPPKYNSSSNVDVVDESKLPVDAPTMKTKRLFPAGAANKFFCVTVKNVCISTKFWYEIWGTSMLVVCSLIDSSDCLTITHPPADLRGPIAAPRLYPESRVTEKFFIF